MFPALPLPDVLIVAPVVIAALVAVMSLPATTSRFAPLVLNEPAPAVTANRPPRSMLPTAEIWKPEPPFQVPPVPLKLRLPRPLSTASAEPVPAVMLPLLFTLDVSMNTPPGPSMLPPLVTVRLFVPPVWRITVLVADTEPVAATVISALDAREMSLPDIALLTVTMPLPFTVTVDVPALAACRLTAPVELTFSGLFSPLIVVPVLCVMVPVVTVPVD